MGIEPLSGNTVASVPPTHEQLAARDMPYGIYAAIFSPEARRRALALRGRGVRVPAKLSPADLVEIVRRANDWPAPCGRLSCLLYGTFTRALLEFFKASFSNFVSTNPFFVFGEHGPPPLRQTPSYALV